MTRAAVQPPPGGRDLGTFQVTALVILRMLIGWHFMYEGLAKITNPYWTSAGYLQAAQGWFSEAFIAVSANPGLLTAVDHLNAWGLLLIGLALLVGVFERVAAWAGILLLALYYLATPPFPGLEYAIPAEGSYLIVNKQLIELAALLVILGFPTAGRVGLKRWVDRILEPGRTGAAAAAEGGAP
ncbi:MAG TPA: DoxX family membrane protein [Longimicrobiales bacterium]|nr:DoxX family membrane protein [Longimicrobiales bacterium]